jgi:hypothetical protein
MQTTATQDLLRRFDGYLLWPQSPLSNFQGTRYGWRSVVLWCLPWKLAEPRAVLPRRLYPRARRPC